MDQTIEMPHDFVIELHHLVTVNHGLVLQAIDADEERNSQKLARITAMTKTCAVPCEWPQTFTKILTAQQNESAAVALTRVFNTG